MKIYGKEIENCDKYFIRLKVAELLNGCELTIPLHVIKGKKEGPVLGLFAAVHGAEYYHNRIIRRIVNETDPEEINGMILAVPVANPLAFSHRSRNTPNPPETSVDFANLNRVFPGKRLVPLFGSIEPTDVSLTMKMAAIIADEVIQKCNYVIDFHGNFQGIAQKKMLYNNTKESFELARIFGLGIIHDTISASDAVRSQYSGLTGYAEKIGIPGICPEIGGCGFGESFEKKCEGMGVQGIRNVMIHLKMFEGEIKLPNKQFYYRNCPHIRAIYGGYLESKMEPEGIGVGKPTREVKKGEVLGKFYNPYTFKEVEQLKAPVDGLLNYIRISGIVDVQNEIYAVADFNGSKWIE